MRFKILLEVKSTLLFALFFTVAVFSDAQPSFRGLEHLFTTPKHYIVGYTPVGPQVDGNISDAVWQKAAWTSLFTDIEGDSKPAPYYQTRAKMLWDKKYLYVMAEMKDEHVWAYLHKHDEIVFFDNDFEIFIDPNNHTHQYFELEFNAINTVFDLFLSKPYRVGGGALIGWNAPGLRSAVKIQGTLNNPKDKDNGWTIECAIPLNALTIGNDVNVPKDGTLWRINFSRVEWDTTVQGGKYVKKKGSDGKNLPENNWVWSPQGVVNMHYPERWGYLQFTTKQDCKEFDAFTLPYPEKQKKYLWLVYYRQHEFKQKNKRFATSFSELALSPVSFNIDGVENTMEMEATKNCFNVVVRAANHSAFSINNEGLIEKRS